MLCLLRCRNISFFEYVCYCSMVARQLTVGRQIDGYPLIACRPYILQLPLPVWKSINVFLNIKFNKFFFQFFEYDASNEVLIFLILYFGRHWPLILCLTDRLTTVPSVHREWNSNSNIYSHVNTDFLSVVLLWKMTLLSKFGQAMKHSINCMTFF